MRVGILGSGLMGGKLGTIFTRAGHGVVFSYARSPKKLERLARDAGGKAVRRVRRKATDSPPAQPRVLRGRPGREGRRGESDS